MKRVLIDVNSVVPYLTRGFLYGVGRSTMELVTALSEMGDLPFDIRLFTQNLRGNRLRGLVNLPDSHFYMLSKPVFKRVSDKLRLRQRLVGYDLMHIPHNTDTTEDLSRTIFTIHDLIVYRYPEMWGLTDAEREEHKRIAEGCRHIITCSEASRQDIMRFWGVPADRVTAIPWGINRQRIRPNSDSAALRKLGVTRPFFFCASCNHPRKNTLVLLQAYEKYLLAGGTMQLVLLAPLQDEMAAYGRFVDRGDIVTCRGVSDDTLNALYTQAHATVMISLFEGFGFPILESLACGTQVICAQNSSLPEVGEDVVDYISEVSPESLAEKLAECGRKDKAELLDYDAAQRHLSQFTWRKCAERYVALYSKLLSV